MKLRLFCVLIFFPLLHNAANAGLIGGDLRFYGTVKALPCDVQAGDENILVDFKDISLKDLLLNQRSKKVPFAIHLINCNTAVYNSVTVTFSGMENRRLPNHLIVTPEEAGADMSAIALGLQTENGTPVILNEATAAQALSGSTKEIKFMAYIEGITDELRQGKVSYGSFSAVANYTLNYQ